MPKVKLKQGRQAQEIGASIVGAWLKALPPTFTATISSMIERNPLTVTVTFSGGNAFVVGDVIALRTRDKGDGISSVKVGQISVTTPTTQTFQVVDLKGNSIHYHGETLNRGAASKVKDLEELRTELEIVLKQIVEDQVNVIVTFDSSTQLTVVVPTLPAGVVTREDLIDYLSAYHKNAQGRHYHDELASAVLFGCR
ncbi:MAG: hypothetical protein E5W09_09655 [Mesorhizobium sp.]|nr:MAG: hypothetical protein E5W09_09655 [Mesorhizobium sp.]